MGIEQIRRLFRAVGIDRAVLFALVARAWQFVSGPITLLLMTLYLSQATRGYFYAFNNLLTLQVFFELSLHIVIVSVASHEWAKLGLSDEGRIIGDASALARLVSLGRASCLWYAVAGLLFAVGCGAGGTLFLAQGSLPTNDWLAAWVTLTVLTGCSLVNQPLTALLEGCDQVAVVNRCRVWQAIVGSLVVWACIASGLGLWAIVGSQAVRVSFDLWLVMSRFRGFFDSFRIAPTLPGLRWSQEVWPMQWRIGLQGLATWWALQLLVPVMFEFHGDVAAGRMGMSWTVLTAMQGAAFAWIETRRPKFGQLVAQRNYGELDRLFLRNATISFAILVAGTFAFWGGVLIVNQMDWPLAVKFSQALLPPLPTFVLCVGVAVFHIPICLAVYVRAHRVEPFLVPSLLLCGSIAVLVTWLGREYGAIGAAAAWTGAIGGFQLPVWLWMSSRFRREWQREPV